MGLQTAGEDVVLWNRLLSGAPGIHLSKEKKKKAEKVVGEMR